MAHLCTRRSLPLFSCHGRLIGLEERQGKQDLVITAYRGWLTPGCPKPDRPWIGVQQQRATRVPARATSL